MIYIAIALTLLQALDGWTTYKIIRRGGYEKNTLIADWIEEFGLYPTLLVVKGACTAAAWVVAVCPVVDDFTASIRLALLAGLTIFYSRVAYQNWKVYASR